jgi:hypothetical protein
MVVHPGQAGAAEQLALLGVTAIVTHPDALSYSEPADPVVDADWGSGYRLVERVPEGTSVWQVVADSAPALVTLPTGFSEPELQDPERLRYALVSPSGVAYAGIRAREAGVLRLSFLAEPPPGGPRELRVADETGTEQTFTLDGPTEVAVLVQVPRGYSLLGLKTDPPPTSSEDAIRVSGFRTERTEGVTELEAHPVEDDPGF